MQGFRLPFPERERQPFARFAIGFACTIMTWASLHDIYLIGVEPRHFTAYHRALLPISNHVLLAIQYASVATLGLGMVFGAATFAVCRLGSWPQLGVGLAWRLFLPFIALIETSTLLVGDFARARHAAGQTLPFPAALYPDETAGIAYTQSVNITAYLAAAGFGATYLLTLFLIRKRSRPQSSATMPLNPA
ncbi:MAG: hypothetical protein WC205_02345 [Opitutaceae bacterium]|jgi:hypothetical protein